MAPDKSTEISPLIKSLDRVFIIKESRTDHVFIITKKSSLAFATPCLCGDSSRPHSLPLVRSTTKLFDR